jgi:hypothetical protein
VPRFSFTNQQTGNPPALSSTNQQTANPGAFVFTNQQPGNAPALPSTSQQSGNAPRFSFTNQQPGNTAALPSTNQQPGNAPRFSFTNQQTENPLAFTFNLPTSSSQVRQPIPSFSVTPSAQKQHLSNDNPQSSLPSTNSPKQITASNEAIKYTEYSTFPLSKKSSDPPTPTPQQPSPPGQEQEESDAPASLADQSLMAKKMNTKLRDPSNLVVDRSDPMSPLYSLKSFEELNLKRDLLKGNFIK